MLIPRRQAGLPKDLKPVVSRPVGATGNPLATKTIGGVTGHTDDITDLFAAEITAVVDLETDDYGLRYGFEEVWSLPDGTWLNATSGRRSDGYQNWAYAWPGAAFAVGDYVLMRRSPRRADLYEILHSASVSTDWFPVEITGNDGGLPPDPRFYSWFEVELVEDAGGGDFGWVPVDPPNEGTENAVRMPSEDYDYPVLPDIPAGQVVLCRASVGWPGKYELTPWGGQLRYVEQQFRDVCVQCEESGGSYVQATYTVTRKLRHYARDLKVAKAPLTDTEGPIGDEEADG